MVSKVIIMFIITPCHQKYSDLTYVIIAAGTKYLESPTAVSLQHTSLDLLSTKASLSLANKRS
jgi:hypothetical protein